MNKSYPLIIGIIFLLCFSACSIPKGKETSETAIEKFHAQFNARQFSEIYNGADDEFKKTVTEQQLTELLGNAQSKLGPVTKSTQNGWHVDSIPSGTIVTMSCDVEFKNGPGNELFTFHTAGDKVLLYNYNIHSSLLPSK